MDRREGRHDRRVVLSKDALSEGRDCVGLLCPHDGRAGRLFDDYGSVPLGL